MRLFNKGSGSISMDESANTARIREVDEARRLEAERRAAELELDMRTRPGTDFCSSRGCKEETGIACNYLDRRERRCPTAWCPEHRVITHHEIYCPNHATLLENTDNGFGVTANPDMNNRVPMLVNWVTRELDAELLGIVQHVANEMHESVVVEPMRFVLFGVERRRTWERSWKVVSHHGVSLRVAVAVEETAPNAVLGKINSKVAVTMPPPWNEEYPFGIKPESADEEDQQLVHFHRALFMGLARTVDEWLTQQRENAEFQGVDASPVYRSGTV